jgi:hypothetical protein
LHEGNEAQGKSDFVQVQTVFFVIYDIRAKLFEIKDKYRKSLPPSWNMRVNPEPKK